MEDEIMKRLKLKIAISEIKKENLIAMDNKRKFLNKKVGMVACLCIVLTTGVVFAKDIETYFKSIFTNSSEAIDKAVENGYVQSVNDDFVYDNDIGVKVDSLVLDDLNLNISFNFETHNENIKSIRFKDFIITNDNEKVVFRSEFKYSETLDELPLYDSVTWNNSPVKLTDTTFADSILFGLRPEREEFKELYFDIKSLQITYTDDRQEIIEGNWKFNVTISDEMRKSNSFHYVFLDGNEYVESCTGIMSNTGLVIELNLKEPFEPMEYIIENSEKLDDTGLFYIINNDKRHIPSMIEGGETEFILSYDNIGNFSENIDTLELYLEPFDTTIVLIKENI